MSITQHVTTTARFEGKAKGDLLKIDLARVTTFVLVKPTVVAHRHASTSQRHCARPRRTPDHTRSAISADRHAWRSLGDHRGSVPFGWPAEHSSRYTTPALLPLGSSATQYQIRPPFVILYCQRAYTVPATVSVA